MTAESENPLSNELKEHAMQITVDADLCTGQGRCYVVSPSLFSSDEVGFCAQRGQTLDVPEGAEHAAQLAVDSCPEGAISIIP